MNHSSLGWLVAGMVLSAQVAAADEGPKPLSAVPFQHVHIHDVFWSPRIDNNRTGTIEANLHQCEITGRHQELRGRRQAWNRASTRRLLQRFRRLQGDRGHRLRAGHASATRSWRSGPTRSSTRSPPPSSRTAISTPTSRWSSRHNRWKNIEHGHELYCAGHLIEAAVAYHQATGKRKLLDVAIKFADHIGARLRPRQDGSTACGHEEIELALVKLYRATGEKRYLDLAKFFLDVRGTDRRAASCFGEYAQDHKPSANRPRWSATPCGRCTSTAAMADVAAAHRRPGAPGSHIEQIWHDVVDRKMYVTGGIGPSAHNEGFTVPYDLPNDTAYAETCAAIGMALWNHRMFLMTGDGKYADVLEREVYNGLLSGVSLSRRPLLLHQPAGQQGQAPPRALVRLLLLPHATSCATSPAWANGSTPPAADDI